MGGHRSAGAVGSDLQFQHPAQLTAGEAADLRVTIGAGADLERVVAVGVGDPYDAAVEPGDPGHSGTRPGGVGERADRAVEVGDPLDRAPQLHGARPTGGVHPQLAQGLGGVVRHREAPGSRARDRELQLRRHRVRRQVPDEPDGTLPLIRRAGAVTAQVAGVHAGVVAVAAQVGAVRAHRVDVAVALVVGHEHEPLADPRRIGELAVQLPQERREHAVAGWRRARAWRRSPRDTASSRRPPGRSPIAAPPARRHGWPGR